MALALRLLLLLLLAVALPARAAQAAPVQGQGADWDAGNVFPAPWLEDNLDPEGLPTGTGVSAEANFPASGLDAVQMPGSHFRGPPKGKTEAKEENKSLKPSELLDQMLSDLERRRELKGEPVQKEAFPRGSSGSLAASAAGREAMPGTATGDWDGDFDYLEVLAHNHFKFLEDAEDNPAGESDLASQPTFRTEPMGYRNDPLGDAEDANSTATPVPNSQKGIGIGFCQRTCWMLGLMSIVAGGELVFILCCVGIRCYWKRKRHHLEEKLKAGGWSRDLYSQKSNSSSSESNQILFSHPSFTML